MSDFKNTNDIDFTGDLEAYRPEEIPALTLDPVSEELPAAEPAKKTAEPVVEMQFTPEEQKAIEEFKKKIDITNANQILRYGCGRSAEDSRPFPKWLLVKSGQKIWEKWAI